MSEWWIGLPPADAAIQCAGQTHHVRWDAGRLRTLDHDDAEGERTLAALGGEPCACVEILDAWARHAADERVLVLASRGPGDRLTVPREPSRTHGWVAYAPLASVDDDDEDEDERDPLLRLLRLDGGVPDRLVAGVAATWTARLAEKDDACRRALPQLHAALSGRAVVALRAWLGAPELAVELDMIDAGATPALSRVDARHVRAELPFSWLSDVWSRGLATVMGRFCLAAATDDGLHWRLSTIGPGLGATETVSLQL